MVFAWAKPLIIPISCGIARCCAYSSLRSVVVKGECSKHCVDRKRRPPHNAMVLVPHQFMVRIAQPGSAVSECPGQCLIPLRAQRGKDGLDSNSVKGWARDIPNLLALRPEAFVNWSTPSCAFSRPYHRRWTPSRITLLLSINSRRFSSLSSLRTSAPAKRQN